MVQRESRGNKKFEKAADLGSWVAVQARQVQPVCGGIGGSFPASLKPKLSAVQARDGVNYTHNLQETEAYSGYLGLWGVGGYLKGALGETGTPVRGCTAQPEREGGPRPHPGLQCCASPLPPQPSRTPRTRTPEPGCCPGWCPSEAGVSCFQPQCSASAAPPLVACPAPVVRRRCLVLSHRHVLFIHAFHPGRVSLWASLVCHLLCPWLNVAHWGPWRRGSAWRRVSPSMVGTPPPGHSSGANHFLMTDSCLGQMLTLTRDPTYVWSDCQLFALRVVPLGRSPNRAILRWIHSFSFKTLVALLDLI